jgi:glycosyltransferase involved in cell wall biosynthesis
VVSNGFDPELVPETADVQESPAGESDAGRVSIVYTGRFGGYGRDPRPLLTALREIAANEPGVAERLELVIAGPVLASERRQLDGLDPIRVLERGVLSRPDTLALQRRADALLLLASPVRSQLTNLKLFEYLAARRPILGLAAGTEAGRMLADAGVDVVRADDPAAIKELLRRAAAGELAAPNAAPPRDFMYPAVAERMAAAVEAAIEARGADW